MPSAADFNYSHAPDPSDPISMVRFLVGDVDASNPILTDSEIQALVSLQPIISFAAASAADTIAARFSIQVDTAIGKTKVSLSQRSAHFTKLANRLRKTAGDLPGGDGTGVPTVNMVVSGLSISQNAAMASDTDRVQPSFTIGMDDDPGSYPNSSDFDRYGGD